MSYLLSNSSQVPEELTIWMLEGHNVFGEPEYMPPEHTEGIWQDLDNLRLTSSSKESETDTVIHSKYLLPVGSWIVQGIHNDAKPPKEAREIRNRRIMKFASARRTTYRYGL